MWKRAEKTEQVDWVEILECQSDQAAEAQSAGRRRPVMLPTEEHVRLHRVSDLPFHDWCEGCVAVRSRGWPHRMSLREEELAVLLLHPGEPWGRASHSVGRTGEADEVEHRASGPLSRVGTLSS